MLEQRFRYKVIRQLLDSDSERPAHLQLMRYITEFLWEEDAHQTLLMVYYARHGSPKASEHGHHGLTLSGLAFPLYDYKPSNVVKETWAFGRSGQ